MKPQNNYYIYEKDSRGLSTKIYRRSIWQG